MGQGLGKGKGAGSSGGGQAQGKGKGMGGGGGDTGHGKGHGQDGRREGARKSQARGAWRGSRGKKGGGRGPPQAGRAGPRGGRRSKGQGAPPAREEGRGGSEAGGPGSPMHPPRHPADAGAPGRSPPPPAHLQHRPQFGGPDSPSHPTSRPAWPHPSGVGAARGASTAGRRPGGAEPQRGTGADGGRPGGAGATGKGGAGTSGVPRPAEARCDWVQDWDAIPDPLGGEILPLVLEVYGLLNLATSGYMRNLPFNAVRLWRDRGNLEVPSGGPVAQEDDESALGDVIWTGWPNRESRWPPFLEGGGGAPRHRHGGQRLAAWGPARHLHPLALPPEEPAAAATRAPTKAEVLVTAGPTGDGASGPGGGGGLATAGWQSARGSDLVSDGQNSG